MNFRIKIEYYIPIFHISIRVLEYCFENSVKYVFLIVDCLILFLYLPITTYKHAMLWLLSDTDFNNELTACFSIIEEVVLSLKVDILHQT